MLRPTEKNQWLWELWFVSAFIIFVTIVFIMTLEGSRSIACLPYLLVGSFINFFIVALIGCRKEKDDSGEE